MGFVPLLLFLGGVDETVLSAKEQQLLDALSPTAEAQGIEIVTVDIVGSKKAPTIRVYIDCEGGVGFDELASAQEMCIRDRPQLACVVTQPLKDLA